MRREIEHGLILFLYLLALLSLFVMNQAVVTRDMGDRFTFQGFALINALILTKVMMLSEYAEVTGRLSHRPKVLAVIAESMLCTALFLAVHTLERVVTGMIRGQEISASMPSFGGGGFPGLVIVSLIFFISLLPFFTFKVLAREVGDDRMWAIFFRSPGR